MSNYAEQSKTLLDAIRILKKYHKCCILRPTGFGKTFALTELLKYYDKVLYLYPSAVIRNTVVERYYTTMLDDKTQQYIDDDGNVIDTETVETAIAMHNIDNVTLMTYAKLVRLSSDELSNMDFDLIISDECHRLGASKTYNAMMELLSYQTSADFVGATATPTRTDTIDVVSVFFNDHTTYTYTLFDFIQDGGLLKPYYIFSPYDIDTDLKEAALTAGQDPNNPVVKEVLNAKLIEISKIMGMPQTIRDTCDSYAPSTDYMKFIIFFASNKHLKDKLNDVVGWFQEAYPNHQVNTLIITSKNKIEQKNVELLSKMTTKPKTIDLIACIDMLNMGYHVNDNTGIVMYRGTKSNIIFAQQFGRALSAGSLHAGIVFDIVDNLHRKAIYDIKPTTTRSTSSKTTKSNTTPVQTNLAVSTNDPSKIVVIDENGNERPTPYYIDDDNNVIDIFGHDTTLCYDDKNNVIIDTSSHKDRNINKLTPECLTFTPHLATYKEILAKAVAESMTERCKRALELHFYSWCINNNIPYPISQNELKNVYGLSKDNFYKYFSNVIAQNKIQYPLHDAKQLMNIGNGNSDIPLNICAARHNVSIAQILETFDIS